MVWPSPLKQPFKLLMGVISVLDILISAVSVILPTMSLPPSAARSAAVPTEISPLNVLLSAARAVAGRRPSQRPSARIIRAFSFVFSFPLSKKASVPARLREPYRRKKGRNDPLVSHGSRCGQERPRPSGHSDSSPRGSFTVTRSRGFSPHSPVPVFLRQTALIAILFRSGASPPPTVLS